MAEAAAKRLHECERTLSEVQRLARIGSWRRELADGSLWWSDELYRIFDIDPARQPLSLELPVLADPPRGPRDLPGPDRRLRAAPHRLPGPAARRRGETRPRGGQRRARRAGRAGVRLRHGPGPHGADGGDRDAEEERADAPDDLRRGAGVRQAARREREPDPDEQGGAGHARGRFPRPGQGQVRLPAGRLGVPAAVPGPDQAGLPGRVRDPAVRDGRHARAAPVAGNPRRPAAQ